MPEITVLQALTARQKALPNTLAAVDSRGGWWPIVRESYAGAWQQNVEVTLVNVLTHPTVFACVSLIASDIAKMRLRLVQLDDDGIWNEVENPAYSPLMRKPNRFQTRIDFIKSWLISKLAHGNTYVLKQRDNRRVVTALYVLDPTRVRPLVSNDGAVYYDLGRDFLSQQREEHLIVPASEIIHDKMHTLYHPLVGIGPIHACGLAATLGLKIQTNSANFFNNAGNPSGILTAPGAISDATAARLSAYWNENFIGENAGKVAVAGDGLKFEPITVKASDAQTTEQWKETSKSVCSAFRVPAYKVGVEPPPSYNNIEALDRQYYSQCLQELVETIEALWDEGMGLGAPFNKLGSEFDLRDLFRMDTATQTTVLAAQVGAALRSPNEARLELNLPPVDGGDSPYLQQQNYSLAALDRRDTALPAPATMRPQLPPARADVVDAELIEDEDDIETRSALILTKELAA